MQRFNTYQTAPVPSGGSDWQAEINGGGMTAPAAQDSSISGQSAPAAEYAVMRAPGSHRRDRSTSPCPVDR